MSTSADFNLYMDKLFRIKWMIKKIAPPQADLTDKAGPILLVLAIGLMVILLIGGKKNASTTT